MDFHQKFEETLVEQAGSYDVIMESPIYALDRKMQQRSGDKMSSSLNSTLDDITPSDSGIQLMDSESSELMNESITSQSALELDDSKTTVHDKEVCIPKMDGLILHAPAEMNKQQVEADFMNIDTNCNVTEPSNEVDVMTASVCSTFDTDSIVYRRKVRKSQVIQKPLPKKRVSFHEDILKNTRTDNIHIEHGFITYKNGRKMVQNAGIRGRYSWCSGADGAAAAACDNNEELCINQIDGDSQHNRLRRVVYRNACSDVLDYGNSDAYDTKESLKIIQNNNSGIFEYATQQSEVATTKAGHNQAVQDRAANRGQVLYKCSCSSSNSSLDSEENGKNSNQQQYGQAKSSSCDCIGMSQANNNLIGDNCYFSEPNIDNLNELNKKSVWNKEKKPKSSCLKKTKRHTNIIQEQDLNTKVKKFNVHNVNQLIDNSSKMIFGSLKSIFTMPLPERGVPEGSEDLQAVVECVAEIEQTPKQKKQHSSAAGKVQQATSPPTTSPTLKAKPFLSKSLDGSSNKSQQQSKQFVHNVDEQLRRKNEEELYAPTRQNSDHEQPAAASPPSQEENLRPQAETDLLSVEKMSSAVPPQKQFRNKFIVNCESTVFEHTGVSYSYETNMFQDFSKDNEYNIDLDNRAEKETTPIALAESDRSGAFISMPIKKTFSNFFRSFRESTASPTAANNKRSISNSSHCLEKPNDAAKVGQAPAEEMKATPATDNFQFLKMGKQQDSKRNGTLKNMTAATSSSTISELTTSTTSTKSIPQKSTATLSSNSLTHLDPKQSRHLASPLKKRQLNGGNLQTTALPMRYEHRNSSSRIGSPDQLNGYAAVRGGSGRDSKSTILSDDFDDILTVTTDTDKNESDIVMVDYPDLNDRSAATDYSNLLKPPQTKTSLINRFLRNVTQKKILETSIRKNNFFANKLKTEQNRFANSLYVRGAKATNFELIDDLNAEIAMEIEMSGANSPRRELNVIIEPEMHGDVSGFELGIGEISIDYFNGNYVHILRDSSEQLMKVFKLYTGYSKEGFMTPVLVFLTDKTLYVTDLIRNRLCSKYELAYVDLDVILLGPYGNTVLLSNSARDMQQVLLAGGPYPADGLVASLELCARRSGSILPAVGQLTLEHLAPLQAFVRENSSVDKDDTWVYYAVVNVPSTGTIGAELEPLGPHIKGFLMHRRVKANAGNNKKHHWNPGYFLLKAGVLYMFNDSTQRLPSWAMALAECQGARRAMRAGRPHCFEILLKGVLLQLAAPDEYVASEWLQAFLQSASGLFEMQEKHKTLGCTLVVTRNHLITLREDFSAPLRVINKVENKSSFCNQDTEDATTSIKDQSQLKLPEDNSSLLSSTLSTPIKDGTSTIRSSSSVNSTPTKLSRSTATFNNSTSTTDALLINTTTKHSKLEKKANFSGMSSVYGENSGLEILTCADIKELTAIKIPSHTDTWWCIVEFSCQEVRECSDDLVIFFASSSEMQRFLRLVEQLWQAKNNDLFPITVLDEDDVIAEQCTVLYMDINRSWEPLLSAALGYPL